MAKVAATLTLSLFILYFISGGNSATANNYEQKTWCVAKPSSDQATLLANINYACSQVDCRILQKGCPCFSPDNLMNHASIAMNMYYQSRGRNRWNCDFRNSGLIVMTDPSYGNCIYA
ncbi:glucan endo-1,3-beta-glucosidase [Ricinus communis]|uniref:Hydrolase, hydrolyzing O-glycosyl compounds, putative n=1 Tax=Ricinus communis TaxID=3988 RepID=B9SR72_RICCO|nr:glucan endo-1,3-beta-glucosidase [Ricinus communis]XP_048234742.1 glucan endo-1,3-beta-glucosidase [Ricinus communis]EEF33908.1 hydrolase, hydrolyzing O-glycosyl compounds, putative [Ricinus communis]|eukprot:XP_002528491.1 glucan endo-1,3-beta-glucosidase [Ricinus communis]